MPSSHNGHISITGVSKYYGRHKALDDVSLEIPPGTVTVILGPSGSGKSTLLRTINHLERVDEGFIQIDGDYIGYRRKGDKLYEMKEKEILRQRINVGYVFQNFNLFPHLTVLENLKLGAYLRKDKAEIEKDLKWVYELFPRLEERNWQSAGTLSGGEQQMLAVGRALMSRPKLMMLDEPSLGLAPLVVQDIFSIIREINRQGVTVLLIEQNANMALKIADLAYVLETGNITMSGTGAELLADSRVKEAYLGKSS